jgi:hypothetical protein
MKVFEILRSDVPNITEQEIIEQLKHFNWKYEFSDDSSVVKKGEKQLEMLENIVYKFWKENPKKAVQLWNTYSSGSANLTTTPSFIFRLQAQEEDLNVK